MKLSNKQLRQIIYEELTNVLQEAYPDFTKRKKTYDMPDFTKRKKPSTMPDFTKRKKQATSPKDLLMQKFGIGPLAIKVGVSKIIEVYYRLRSGSMPRENPDYGKLPDGFSNPQRTIDADQDFLDLLSKIAGKPDIAKLPLPYEEEDVFDREWGDNIIHGGYKGASDPKLYDRIAYLFIKGNNIEAVFFGRG